MVFMNLIYYIAKQSLSLNCFMQLIRCSYVFCMEMVDSDPRSGPFLLRYAFQTMQKGFLSNFFA